MTRSKNTKSGKKAKFAAANGSLSYKTALKKSFKPKVRKPNPFEIRFVKEKHSVVNRKIKTDVGKPGISRAKAIQKRKDTLLQEYKRKDKTNVFVDRRIGEKDSELSAEDKMIARFAAERINQGKKQGSIFNLGEEETLTHFGKSLADIERYEDPRSDDEDEDGSGGAGRKKLDASYVDAAHFGGFLTKSDAEYESGKGNTRKDWIEQMIADSKKRKAEKTKDLEEAEQMTHDLDENWKKLLPAVAGSIYSGKKKEEEEKEKDDYNVLMRELMFESSKRAKAQERLKSEEEVIKDEKERLEKLEANRNKRMNGEVNEDQTLTEIDEEVDDIADEENENADNSSDESDSNDEEDQYSDLDSEEEESKKTNSISEDKASKYEAPNEMIEAAKKEIPFTFAVPTSYDELISHFEGRSASDKALIIERMIKCNHPQFSENNKSYLENLFRFMLQHIHECCEYDEEKNLDDDLRSVASLTPYLYDLAKFFPAPAAKSILGVIQEKYEEYCKKPRSYPTLESLIFCKLTILLFPSSDYRHPVVTPTLQWMSHMLSSAKANSTSSLASGLFIATVFIEAVSLSKRFSPELLNFLCGIVDISTPEDKTLPPKLILQKHVPPFKPIGNERTLFCDTFSNGDISPEKLKLSDTVMIKDEGNVSESFSVTCLYSALGMLLQLAELWKELPSSKQIFSRLKNELLPNIPMDRLNCDIKERIEKLVGSLEAIMNDTEVAKRLSLAKEREKPVTMLKLYEPEFEDNFDPSQKKRVGSREKLEMDKLQHKVKRERKSAKKDIRKDSAFLAKHKAKEARATDKERIQKTRSIMSGLGSQEGEYRKFLASKKKKKF